MFEPHHRRRDHVGRHDFGDALDNRDRIEFTTGVEAHIRDQRRRAARRPMNHRRGEVDAVLGEQCRVDLAEFDAETTDLDLGVGPADELERAVPHLGSSRRPHPAHLVTGAVEPRPRLTEGVGHESVRRQPVPMVIAACDSGAGEVELTHHPAGTARSLRSSTTTLAP